MSDPDPPHAAGNPAAEAERVCEEALEHQMLGDLEEAIRLYRRSIQILPTAKAHTFLGWTYSFQGRAEEAIQECLRAIEVDPRFGNPYNDIGVYLIEMGRHEEAIPWLQKAIAAPDYEPRHFPHYNLARVFVRLGRVTEALRELESALQEHPGYTLARRELERLISESN